MKNTEKMCDICGSTENVETIMSPTLAGVCMCEKCSGISDGGEYKVIGWIAHGMDVYKKDQYKAMFGKSDVRKPPKIYKTEKIAKRYGNPVAVYVKIPSHNNQ